MSKLFSPSRAPGSAASEMSEPVQSQQAALSALARSTACAQVVVVTTMPRGGLQILQPPRLLPALLRTYRELHENDRFTWTALARGAAVSTVDAAGEQAESDPYLQGLSRVADIRYGAAAPLAAPVIEGYPGALHIYRTRRQRDFSASHLRTLTAAAAALDELGRRQRATRAGCADRPDWHHRPPQRIFPLDSAGRPLAFAAEFQALDESLKEEMTHHASHRAANLNGDEVPSSRMLFPDRRGDRWTFNMVTYRSYPALSDGPVVMFCLQPTCEDWGVLRPIDFIANPEIARLIPALKFMRKNFRQSPTLRAIARTAHFSPFHFHRRFTDRLGLTPKHYMLECQISAAKQEISEFRELRKIASSCGFAHQSHFTSRFKQATGLSPTRWRRAYSMTE